MQQLANIFEDMFGEQDFTVRSKELTLCSGGTRVSDKEPLPAIYATETLATEAWLDTVYLELNDKNIRYKWIEPPLMRQIQITLMDTKEQERFVQIRWAVTAKLMYEIVEKPNAKISEGETTSAAA